MAFAKRRLDQALGFNDFLEIRNILTLTEDESLVQDMMFVALTQKWIPSLQQKLVKADLRQPEFLLYLQQWLALMPDRFLSKLL